MRKLTLALIETAEDGRTRVRDIAAYSDLPFPDDADLCRSLVARIDEAAETMAAEAALEIRKQANQTATRSKAS